MGSAEIDFDSAINLGELDVVAGKKGSCLLVLKPAETRARCQPNEEGIPSQRTRMRSKSLAMPTPATMTKQRNWSA